MRQLHLSTSYKQHILIALLIGLWLVIFLIVIAPFDVSELPLKVRLELMPLYGVITFLGYMILVPFQNMMYSIYGKWNVFYEVIFITAFNILVLMGSFLYYRSDIMNGAYDFETFALTVYYPIFLLVLSMIIILRWVLFKKNSQEYNKNLILTGENRLDVLQINPNELICISSADNYVEVSYLQDNILKKKLLRNSLKNMQEMLPELVKVHRSHLINPKHFIEYKNSQTLQLTQMEVPVSKAYKESFSTAINHP